MVDKNSINSGYSKYNSCYYEYNDNIVNTADIEAEKEYNAFLEKLTILDKSLTPLEAKEQFKTIFPIKEERTLLKIGNAKCIIISGKDLFRICIDSEKEYICYNFINQNIKK